jgi:predicted dehydrogenase
MPAGASYEPLTMAVAGDDPARWLAALRGVDGVAADRIDLRAPDDLLETLARDEVGAIALAGSLSDLSGAIKRSLVANRHVLVFGASALASKQLLALDALARRRGRVLIFAPDCFADARIEFVRKMTSGANALWRPRYLRSLRTGPSLSATIDALAITDIACTVMILGGTPARVSAIAPRLDDESGGGDVAMVTLMFDSGPVARIDVSLIEPEPRHELILGCEGRTVTLDSYDARAPMRIESAGRGRTSRAMQGGWIETMTEHPLEDSVDRYTRAATAFVEAVRARDLAAPNARQMADAAHVWERARESMLRGGELLDIDPSGEIERPKLKLIVGGGHFDVAHPAPDLTVIDGGRQSAPPSFDPDPEPLRTA